MNEGTIEFNFNTGSWNVRRTIPSNLKAIESKAPKGIEYYVFYSAEQRQNLVNSCIQKFKIDNNI